MFTGWTAEFLRKSKTDGTNEEKKSTWNPRQRDVPSGARRSSRRLNPSSGLRKQAWGVAPTEALVTAEEEEKPADTGGRARRAPVRPVDQDKPQKQTPLSLEKKCKRLDKHCQHQKKWSKILESGQIAEDIDWTQLLMSRRRRCSLQLTRKSSGAHLEGWVQMRSHL